MGIASGEPGASLVTEMLPVAAPVVVGANFAVNDVPCPAVRVAGVVNPLMLKPVPEALAAEIVTLAVPVFVKVTAMDAELPSTRLPKTTLVGLAVSFPCVPVPLKGIVIVGSEALLEIVIEPEALPDTVGANFAVKDLVPPAATVAGTVSPVMLKPVPDALAAETVTLVVPLFVSVIDCVLLLPTPTLPNAKLPGFATRAVFAATPLPEMARVCGEFGALSANTMLPVVPPAVAGVNVTLKEALCPAPRVAGNARPLIPNPLPVSVARFKLRFTLPLFVSFTVCELLCPTVTFPKLSEVGDMVSPACVPVPLKAIFKGELAESLAIERLPVTAPPDGGANLIWSDPLWPTPITLSGLPPTAVNPAPEMLAESMLTVAVPVFVNDSVWVELLPTAMLPKLRLVALGVKIPELGSPVLGECALVTPAQLERLMTARTDARAASQANRPWWVACLPSGTKAGA